MTQGIYKITNKKNGKIYIGQSVNIEQRLSNHKSDYNNPSKVNYNIKLYRSMRKHGLESFTFEIIEEISQNLTEREQHYIDLYDSINIGYNTLNAIDPLTGENNPNAKLSVNEVLEIYELLRNTDTPAKEIAEMYSIDRTHVYRLNRGDFFVQPGVTYPVRTETYYARPGTANGRGKIEDDEVLRIRLRYSKGETVKEIYEDYKTLYSESGFKKIVQGASYDHIPVYKKREKCWKLNDIVVPVETISFVGE